MIWNSSKCGLCLSHVENDIAKITMKSKRLFSWLRRFNMRSIGQSFREKEDTHKLVLEKPINLSTENNIEHILYVDIKNFTEILAIYVLRYICRFRIVLHKLRKKQESEISNHFFVKVYRNLVRL